MLVLSRRQEESILIGDNITVRIVGIGQNRVRLAIDAPPEIAIDREEVRHRIRKEVESATDALPTAVQEPPLMAG